MKAILLIAMLCMPCLAYTEATVSNYLRGIKYEEVRDSTNVTVHSDGVSYGDHGVTMGACQRLVDEKLLVRLPTVAELCDPETNRAIARLYLLLMYDQYGSWWEAVGRYHGGNKERRNAYAKRVWGWL